MIRARDSETCAGLHCQPPLTPAEWGRIGGWRGIPHNSKRDPGKGCRISPQKVFTSAAVKLTAKLTELTVLLERSDKAASQPQTDTSYGQLSRCGTRDRRRVPVETIIGDQSP